MSQDLRNHTKCTYISCTAFQSHHVLKSPQHRGCDDAQKQSNNVEDSSRPQQVVKMHNVLAAPHLCVLMVPSSHFHSTEMAMTEMYYRKRLIKKNTTLIDDRPSNKRGEDGRTAIHAKEKNKTNCIPVHITLKKSMKWINISSLHM